MEAPKAYAEIVKTTISAGPTPSKNAKIEIKAQKRTQLEALQKERLKFTITLSIKDVPSASQHHILSLSGKDIAERCLKAVN